jgi:hypothetical protein
MGLPPIDDLAALHDRMTVQENQNEIWMEHYRVLAQQIAELTIATQRLAKQNSEIERRIPELTAQGIAAAVGNPATWQAARDAMKQQARDAAGNWILGSLRFLIDKMMWAAIALLAIYTLGGWPALAAAFKLKAAA